jgi:hypothetical protein
VEWRTLYFNQRDMPPTLNYEIQLQEGQSTFKYVYELVTSYNNADTSLTIGTQLSRNLDIYTEYYCDPTGETAPPLTGKQLTWVYDPCGTPIASATSTRTPTGTATPFTPGPTNTSGGCFDNGSVPVTCTPTPIVTNTATNTHTPLPTQTPGGPSATPEPSNTSTAEATVTPTICAISFTDVSEGHTFYPYIMCLACRDIISGYTSSCETGDPCFRPGNNVTRGQIAKIVSNAAGFNEPVTGQTFEDVPTGHTFYDFVERLASREVMSGYPCGSPGEPCNPPDNRPYFRPNGTATRGQLAKIVSNAAGFNEPVTGQTFEDIPPGHTFYDFIERLATRGVMSGYPCGGLAEPCVPPDNRPYFRPNANVTRGQTTKIVANTFFPECAPGR